MRKTTMNKGWMVLLTILAAALVFSGGWAFRASAQGEPAPANRGSEAFNPEVEQEHSCTIVNVAAYENRIHVRCTTAPSGLPGVVYFAASSDPINIQKTNRYLMLLNTGVALNKTVGIRFESATSANPPGCITSDCRKLVAVWLVP